jgi:hypothetical protein
MFEKGGTGKNIADPTPHSGRKSLKGIYPGGSKQNTKRDIGDTACP